MAEYPAETVQRAYEVLLLTTDRHGEPVIPQGRQVPDALREQHLILNPLPALPGSFEMWKDLDHAGEGGTLTKADFDAAVEALRERRKEGGW